MKTKAIPNSGKYVISEDGVVINITTGKKLATQLNTRGYETVNLWSNNKLKKFLVHRLVAQVFLPNPMCLPCVNHIDKNKTNNSIKETLIYSNNYFELMAKRSFLSWLCVVRIILNLNFVFFDLFAGKRTQ